MEIRVRSALPSSLIAAPDGIDRQLSSFRALEAYQLLSARHSWGGEHGKRIPTPGLCWKYEDLVRQLFALSFPERAGQELSIPDVYELLGAIEPAILLYYDIDEIREGVLPEEVREGLYKYMRCKNITLADFALEPMKIARAFRGYHYGVPNFDSFKAKFKVMRRMHKELNGSLDKLHDAWNVCMQDLALFASCNQSADPMEKLRSEWGPENTELLDSLVQAYGLPEIPAPYLQFAAAPPRNTFSNADSIKSAIEQLEFGSPTIGAKISAYLIYRSLRAITGIGGISFGIAKNWITKDEMLILKDELGEMKAIDGILEESLKEYAKAIKKTGLISIENIDLSPYYTNIDGGKGEIVFPSQSKFFINSAGWWLNGAHKVIAIHGTFTVEKGRHSYMDLKSADIEMEWIDVIDANPSYKEDNLIKATAEYIFKMFDETAKASYPVKIKWRFSK